MSVLQRVWSEMGLSLPHPPRPAEPEADSSPPFTHIYVCGFLLFRLAPPHFFFLKMDSSNQTQNREKNSLASDFFFGSASDLIVEKIDFSKTDFFRIQRFLRHNHRQRIQRSKMQRVHSCHRNSFGRQMISNHNQRRRRQTENNNQNAKL